MKFFILSWWLGWHYQKANRHGVDLIISKTSTIGIALGVAVLVIGLSAMNGFERELSQRVLSLVPHGELFPITGNKQISWSKIAAKMLQQPEIKAVSPYIQVMGILRVKKTFKVIQLRGIDPVQEQKITSLAKHVLPITAWDRLTQGEAKILLGAALADSLRVTVGDRVTLFLSDETSSSVISQPKCFSIEVVGILHLGSQLEQYLALISLDNLQQFLGLDKNVKALALKVSSVFQAGHIIQRAVKQSKLRGFHAYSWESQYGSWYKDIQLIRFMVRFAMLLVIGIASFNVASILMLTIKKRLSDIAILITMGATAQFICKIFLCYGTLIGIIGGAFGVIIGTILAKYLTTIVGWLEHCLQYELLSSNVYFINFLPSEIRISDIMTIYTVTIILSILASVYPAYYAIKRDPISILNHH